MAWWVAHAGRCVHCALTWYRALDDKPKELRITVDLDEEQGRPASAPRDNTHRIVIRQTARVPLAAIDAYLSGKITFDNSVLEAISEHLNRVGLCAATDEL